MHKLWTIAVFASMYMAQPLSGENASAHSTPSVTTAPAFDAAAGAKLFTVNCAGCHLMSGVGVPGVFPPLAGSAVVNDADPTAHIDTVLHGLSGVKINGTAYTAQMPPFAALLSDVEVANIINHERTSWGNHGELVAPADVAGARARK